MPAIIKVVDGRTIIKMGENTALASKYATLAEQFANAAGVSVDAVEIAAAAVGVYTTVGAGESATTNGQSFYVASGGDVTLYLNNAGTGDEVASIVTTAKLASTAPGEGAALVGFKGRTAADNFDDRLNILNYGVIPDNVTGNAAALNAVAVLARSTGKGLYCPYRAERIYLESEVDLTGIRNIDIQTRIRVDPTIVGIPVSLGGFAQGGDVSWKFSDVSDATGVGTFPTRPIVRIAGAKRANIEIGSCEYLQFYADSALGAGYASTAYNRVMLHGVIRLLEITDGGGFSWVNENRFYGGPIGHLRIVGVGYSHNHNKFFDNTFEGSNVEFTYTNTSNNQVFGARFENVASAPGANFAADTYNNSIEWTWQGTGVTRANYQNPIDVVDLGQGNSVHSHWMVNYRRVPLFNIGPESVLTSTATRTASPNPRIASGNAGIDNFVIQTKITPGLISSSVLTNRYLALTEPIPVQVGDVVKFGADFDGNQARLVIHVLDENRQPLTDEGGGGPFISQSSTLFTSSYGRYGSTTNLSAQFVGGMSASVLRPEVAYIRVGIYMGSGATGIFRHLSADLYVQPTGREKTLAQAETSVLRSIDSVPTQGYAPIGYTLYNRATSAITTVTFAYETSLSVAAAASATSVTITAATGVMDGDVVGILLDDQTTHWSVVSALSGETFTVDALPSAAAIGARVVFNRWE